MKKSSLTPKSRTALRRQTAAARYARAMIMVNRDIVLKLCRPATQRATPGRPSRSGR